MACFNGLCKKLEKLLPRREQRSLDSGKSEILDSGRIYVNPYSPSDTILVAKIVNKEKSRKVEETRKALFFSSSETYNYDSSISVSMSPRPVELKTSCVTRYSREFQELDRLGSGSFGEVFRCMNRLDGCVYAIKRSKLLTHSAFKRRRATNEVQANAALKNHVNLVRYFSAWVENDRMNIQMEFCNGGDLQHLINGMRLENRYFSQKELSKILLQIAEGLRYIHGNKMAHMDIKPENIFISKEKIWIPTQRKSYEDSVDLAEDSEFEEQVIYKIGDFGLSTSIINIRDIEDEGDCRYLAREIMGEDFNDLAKADIFSLGLTMFEAGGGGPLPKNGPTWQKIRDGKLDKLEKYSDELNGLILSMIAPVPSSRPSACDLVRHKFLKY